MSQQEPEADMVDMTELAAAIAVLNGEEPPSGKVTVTASIMTSISTQIKEEAAEKEIESAGPGGLMPDGTIYIGRFKGKNGEKRDWFAAAEDLSNVNHDRLSVTFGYAAQCAQSSEAYGHNDWTLPPGGDDDAGRPDILQEMFNSKSTGAFNGTYYQGGAGASRLYWSSSPATAPGSAKVRGFHNLEKAGGVVSEDNLISARFVRSVAVKEKHYGA